MPQKSTRKIKPVKITSPKRSRGRPTIYKEEIVLILCDRLAHGEALTTICRDPQMPSYRSILRWRLQHGEFARLYEQARLDQADTFIDQVIRIADDVDEESAQINKAKLMIEVRKWAASQLRQKTEHNAGQDNPHHTSLTPAMAQKIQEKLRQKLGKEKQETKKTNKEKK